MAETKRRRKGTDQLIRTQHEAKDPEPMEEYMASPQGSKDSGQELGNDVERDRIFDEWEHIVDDRISQVPPVGFLGLAAVSMGISSALALFQERKGWATFVSMWVPSLLFLGLYAKITKIEERLSLQELKSPTVH